MYEKYDNNQRNVKPMLAHSEICPTLIYISSEKLIKIVFSVNPIFSGRDGTLDSRFHWYPKFYDHAIKNFGYF